MRKLAVLPALAFLVAAPAVAQPPPSYPPVPPPRYEAVPPPPPGRMVWEPGHWQWNGVQYVWVEGRYVPRHGGHYAHYAPGHWVLRGGTWVWAPAGWR